MLAWRVCAPLGEMATATAGVTVIVTFAALDGSATDAAVRLTVEGGATAGARYVTVVSVALASVPQEEPLQPLPASVKLTPLF